MPAYRHAALLVVLGCGPVVSTVRQPLPITIEGAAPQPGAAASASPPSSRMPRFLDPSSLAFEAEIEAFEATDRQKPPVLGGTLFVGSSSIRGWHSLEHEFSEYGALNRGFGGSSVRNVFDYADRIVIPYRPKRILLFAGSNDIHAGILPLQVAADFDAFVKRVWETLPGTPIAFISITTSPSRFAEVARVKDANRLIGAYISKDPHLAYIDIFSQLLKPDGTPNHAFYAEDGLHPNDNGYEVWSKAIREFLNAQRPGIATEPKPSPRE